MVVRYLEIARSARIYVGTCMLGIDAGGSRDIKP